MNPILAAIVGSIAMAQTNGGVPASITSRLDSGVNITRWFCYTDAHDQDHFQNYWKDEDFGNLAKLKVHFVRLCLSPEVIYSDGQPNPTNFPAVAAAIGRLAAHKLVVIVDLHDNGQLKLDAEGQDNRGLVSFWKAMAKAFQGQREGDLIFEIVNEPVFQKNKEVWYDLQEQCVRAIRAEDPKRTVMASATSWSGIDTLAEMRPVAEGNIVYTYHCYDPFFFTHQGASWVGDYPKAFRAMPFPSSPEAMSEALKQTPEQFSGALKDYGNARYDDAYLRSRIKKAQDWGHDHHVFTVLGEFGSYPEFAPPDSRARWFSGMLAAFKAEHAPYCLWGYDDGLGLGRTIKDGKIWLDPVTLKNLYP